MKCNSSEITPSCTELGSHNSHHFIMSVRMSDSEWTAEQQAEDVLMCIMEEL